MVKIAVSCEEPGLDSLIDPRFGRAAGFCIVDLDTLESSFVDNGSSQAMAQGAGIQAAETVCRSGANVVLTGSVGPKAFRALSAAGIQVGQNLENLHTLGQRYQKLPAGWKFRVVVLDRDLVIAPGKADVISQIFQDEFENTFDYVGDGSSNFQP